MLVMSIGPLGGGILVSALAACIVGLIVAAERRQRVQLPDAPDPESAGRLLTMKLRHPWMYRAEAVRRWISS